MTLLDKAERHLGKFAIKNLAFWLMIGQVFVYAMMLFTRFPTDRLLLVPEFILQGQVWRCFTFLLIPPITHPIFMAFAWYIFYMMGSTLEREWGEFRFNLFVLIGTLATVVASFAVMGSVGTNAFLGTSVFLAFAFLYPNFTFMLFFILPVKVKWLAAITWVFYLYGIIAGPAEARLMILAATVNFFLFFGRDIINRGKAIKRRQAFEKDAREQAEQPFHRCCICGATEKTHPQANFVYKSGRGYCDEHAALLNEPEATQLEAAGGAFKE